MILYIAYYFAFNLQSVQIITLFKPHYNAVFSFGVYKMLNADKIYVKFDRVQMLIVFLLKRPQPQPVLVSAQKLF